MLQTERGIMKIIAVAGGSASGKSLFAQYLGERLPASVLSLDNYYFDVPNSTPVKNYDFDIPSAFDFRSFQKDLEQLRAEVPIQMPHFDYFSGKRQKSSYRILPKKYLIIEGLYVLMHASIRNVLTYSFFLESPPDVILGRRVLRDTEQRQVTLEYCVHQYFHFTRPAYHAHILPTRQFAKMIVTNEYNSRLDVFVEDFLTKYHF